MTAAEVLSALRERGLAVALRLGKPVLRGGNLDAADPLWEALRANRQEIVSILRREAWPMRETGDEFFPGVDPEWSKRLKEARQRRGEQ